MIFNFTFVWKAANRWLHFDVGGNVLMWWMAAIVSVAGCLCYYVSVRRSSDEKSVLVFTSFRSLGFPKPGWGNGYCVCNKSVICIQRRQTFGWIRNAENEIAADFSGEWESKSPYLLFLSNTRYRIVRYRKSRTYLINCSDHPAFWQLLND